MNDLLNKNILITGSTRGIGKRVATSFAEKGANIISIGSNPERLDRIYDQLIKLNQDGDHLIIQCDLSQLDESQAKDISLSINEHYKFLDGVIFNAAILGKMTPLHDYDLLTWRKVINTNLTSQFLLTKALIPHLKRSNSPKILFTSSGVAETGKAYWGAYSVSKFALKGMAEILHQELSSTYGIHVFNFDPGVSPTDMRAEAYPSEDQGNIKSLDDLIPCYEWFFKDITNANDQHYFKYSDFPLLRNST